MSIKKIERTVAGLMLAVAVIFAVPAISQNSGKTALYPCDGYPTMDLSLNSSINELLAQNEQFDARMAFIYQSLSPAQQEQAGDLFARGDESVFKIFPQFNDEELKAIVTRAHDKYAAVVKQHELVFPKLERKQREETIKSLIQCAGGKRKLEKEPVQSGRMAVDVCETERRNCIVSVASEAVGMHVACAWADLTFFAGIVCHAAAFAYQWSAGNNCNIAAQRCRKNG